MSDYIIYDIKMDIEQKLDFDGKVEDATLTALGSADGVIKVRPIYA